MRHQRKRRQSIESGWEKWVTTLYSNWFSSFAPHHAEVWGWAWEINPDIRPQPMLAILSRFGGKTTMAEALVTMLGARKVRKYGLYVRANQDLADSNINNIASLLEGSPIGEYYPGLADRKVGKYGNSRGWRRNRLHTDSGFKVDAAGLDTAIRGLKIDADRPDFIILDDIDSRLDSGRAIKKKLDIIRYSILPAGIPQVAVLVVQNLIRPDGVVGKILSREAEILADRIVAGGGPIPAIRNFSFERKEQEDGTIRAMITGGTPSWDGQNLETCQQQIDTYTIKVFLEECQHEVLGIHGDIFNEEHFRRVLTEELPDFLDVVVWCDPAVTSTDSSDANGVAVAGVTEDGRLYILWSWEERSTAINTLRIAILAAVRFGARKVGVEVNQGGDLWELPFEIAAQQLLDEGQVSPEEMPWQETYFIPSSLGSKVARASRLAAAYSSGTVYHLAGETTATLEKALLRFPAAKPYDLVDTVYHCWRDLVGDGQTTVISVDKAMAARQQDRI